MITLHAAAIAAASPPPRRLAASPLLATSPPHAAAPCHVAPPAVAAPSVANPSVTLAAAVAIAITDPFRSGCDARRCRAARARACCTLSLWSARGVGHWSLCPNAPRVYSVRVTV